MRAGGMRNRTGSDGDLAGKMATKVATTPTQQQQMAMNTFAWFMNVSTSVMIIFVNKQLMSGSGMGFHYGAAKWRACACVFSRGWRGSKGYSVQVCT